VEVVDVLYQGVIGEWRTMDDMAAPSKEMCDCGEGKMKMKEQMKQEGIRRMPESAWRELGDLK
jgi:hypothetical protein